MENEKRIIEINGIKMEIDLRTAKRIDEFKIGDNVKVLRRSGNEYTVLAGVIIDFVDFKELPTIQIATFRFDYWGNHLEFINFNAQSKDLEVCGVSEHELALEKNKVVDQFDREIAKKTNELDDILNKKNYLLKHFGKYFTNQQ